MTPPWSSRVGWLLAATRIHGYHHVMSNYRRAAVPGGTFFFTAVTFQRQRVLTLTATRRRVAWLTRSVAMILQDNPRGCGAPTLHGWNFVARGGQIAELIPEGGIVPVTVIVAGVPDEVMGVCSRREMN